MSKKTKVKKNPGHTFVKEYKSFDIYLDTDKGRYRAPELPGARSIYHNLQQVEFDITKYVVSKEMTENAFEQGRVLLWLYFGEPAQHLLCSLEAYAVVLDEAGDAWVTTVNADTGEIQVIRRVSGDDLKFTVALETLDDYRKFKKEIGDFEIAGEEFCDFFEQLSVPEVMRKKAELTQLLKKFTLELEKATEGEEA